jgi:hypothetical protein
LFANSNNQIREFFFPFQITISVMANYTVFTVDAQRLIISRRSLQRDFGAIARPG